MNHSTFWSKYGKYFEKEYVNCSPVCPPIEVDRFVFELSVYNQMVEDVQNITLETRSSRVNESLLEVLDVFLAINIRKFISPNNNESHGVEWLIDTFYKLKCIDQVRCNHLKQRLDTLRKEFYSNSINPNKSLLHRDENSWMEKYKIDEDIQIGENFKIRSQILQLNGSNSGKLLDLSNRLVTFIFDILYVDNIGTIEPPQLGK